MQNRQNTKDSDNLAVDWNVRRRWTRYSTKIFLFPKYSKTKIYFLHIARHSIKLSNVNNKFLFIYSKRDSKAVLYVPHNVCINGIFRKKNILRFFWQMVMVTKSLVSKKRLNSNFNKNLHIMEEETRRHMIPTNFADNLKFSRRYQ